MKDTLCWECRRAVGLCPWSRFGEAVDGWKAIPTVIEEEAGNFNSFLVLECPLFQEDEKGRKEVR